MHDISLPVSLFLLNHPLTRPHTLSLTHSPTISLTHSLYSATLSLTHSITLSPTLSLTRVFLYAGTGVWSLVEFGRNKDSSALKDSSDNKSDKMESEKTSKKNYMKKIYQPMAF